MNDSKLPYRPNVCILLYNSAGRLLLGERFGSPGVWQFPQGGVSEDGTLEESVIREIEEELGITSSSLGKVTKLASTHRYDFAVPPKYAVGRFRGQSQTFWAVEFTGKDSEIDLKTHEPQEFSDWKWCTVDEVKTIAEPKRLTGYSAPLGEFERLMKQ